MGKQCEICGELFHPLNMKKRCCSKKCYSKLHRLTHERRIKDGTIDDLKLTTGRYSQLKKRVKDKDFSYLMPKEEYMKLIQQSCYYCGEVTYGIEKGVGLDRLDCSKEYTLDNVVPCCGKCNRSKSDVHTPDQYKKMMRVDEYIKVLSKLNKAQKVERSLEEFISYIKDKY